MELTIPDQRTWMLKSVVEEDKICLELAEKPASDEPQPFHPWLLPSRSWDVSPYSASKDPLLILSCFTKARPEDFSKSAGFISVPWTLTSLLN